MSKPMVVIPKEEYEMLLRFERVVMAYFGQQKAQYLLTMQSQFTQQPINVVSQQIH